VDLLVLDNESHTHPTGFPSTGDLCVSSTEMLSWTPGLDLQNKNAHLRCLLLELCTPVQDSGVSQPGHVGGVDSIREALLCVCVSVEHDLNVEKLHDEITAACQTRGS